MYLIVQAGGVVMSKDSAKTTYLSPTKSKNTNCYLVSSVFDETWKSMPPFERERCLVWTQEFAVTEGSLYDEGNCYRQFEFRVALSPEMSDYRETKELFLEPYLQLKDARGEALSSALAGFEKEENDALHAICIPSCRLYCEYKHSRDGEPSCYHPFVSGVRVEFRLELPRQRKRKSKDEQPDERTISIRDLRLWGHPVRVELKYLSVKSAALLARLVDLPCCYPGSGKRAQRFSRRLGERIDEALVNGMKKDLIAEGSAVPRDTIYHWEKRSLRKASQCLAQTSLNRALQCCTEISKTCHAYFDPLVQIGKQAPRRQHYMVMLRQLPGTPWRITAFYKMSEVRLFRYLADGCPPSSFYRDSGLPISPRRLFGLAVDLLSDHCYNAPHGSHALSVLAVIGALPFLAVCEPADPGCGKRILLSCKCQFSGYYLSCYERLLPIFDECQENPLTVLAKILPYILEPLPCDPRHLRDFPAQAEEIGLPLSDCNDPLIIRAIDWRDECLRFYKPENTPHGSAHESHSENFSFILQRRISTLLPQDLQFPLPSGVSSMEEFITRILIFNPASMSTRMVENQSVGLENEQEIGLEGEREGISGQSPLSYKLSVCRDGTPDFEHVIPGIEIPQLENLMQQGFLMQERTSLFQRPISDEDHIV